MLAVIPFYQKKEQLDRCLAALGASSAAVEPFVHDNTARNLGFTRACNLGLREALRRGDAYVLLLNQDCYVQPDAVARSVAFMEEHPRCAIVGFKQLRADEPDLIVHGGCTDAHPAGRHITGRVSSGECAESLPMPWVNGACWVVRLAAVVECGLMDEGYFNIASDSDYCFTVRERGWEVWYCADAVVLHEAGGVSSAPPTLEQVIQAQADQRRFRDKWVGSPGFELLRVAPPHRAATADEVRGALERAQHHYSRNELLQAELLCRHLLAFVPNHPDGLLILGRVLTRSGFASLATRELRKVVEAAPSSGPAHQALADALILSGAADDAVTHYRRAQALGIDTADLHNNLGVAFHRQDRRDEAIRSWRHVLAVDPDNAVARKNLQDIGVTDLPPARLGAGPASIGGSGTYRMG